ncbi:MAG TPA: HXXEE domain-containing protein, partial [Solirubrobacterales bacterium]|nr:HXXEE domain-containing protein [Solirubrobacterales bacterium]
VDTHGRWPRAAAALPGPAWAAALSSGKLRSEGAWVATLGFPILVTHQTEEWVRPGGFLPFCNQRLLGSTRETWPLTERDGFHVNVTLGWSSALLAATTWNRTAAPAAFVLWVEAGNALMHTAMALRERRYNPGLATATLLMGVHAASGAVALRRSGRLSHRGGRLAAAAGIAFSAGLPLAMKLRMRATLSTTPDDGD